MFMYRLRVIITIAVKFPGEANIFRWTGFNAESATFAIFGIYFYTR